MDWLISSLHGRHGYDEVRHGVKWTQRTIGYVLWENSIYPGIRPRIHLGEQRVEAVHFLALLDEGVVLRDALEGQVVHEVYLVRVGDELVLEGLDRDWKVALKRQIWRFSAV